MWVTPVDFTSNYLPQVILSTKGASIREFTVAENPETWLDTLLVPSYTAAASIAILSVHGLTKLAKKLFGRHSAHLESDDDQVVNENRGIRGHIIALGGPVIFAFRVLRLFGIVALLALSILTVVLNKHHHHKDLTDQWVHLGLVGVYAYSTLLSLVSIFGSYSTSNYAIRHLALVLFATWSTFIYRDLWPFATFTLSPLDRAEGWLLWIKVALLSIVGVLIPLLVPRHYVPVDPKEPMEVPNPEQTASIFSLAFYFFLDSIIFLGYRSPHLSYDQLPPLADYDATKNLVKRSFPLLDPFVSNKRRHLFFGLMQVFRWEYVVLTLMVMLRVITSFASPVGLYRLLNYLQNGPGSDFVRPWIWVSWLLLGPVIGSMAVHWYIFVATRMLVQSQAIITQLVFDHALRIRVKAEVAKSSASTTSSAVTTPDNASVAESEATGQGEEDATASEGVRTARTASSSTAATTAVGKAPAKGKAPSESGESTKSEKADKEEMGGNLVGRINNLVTTDLNNLVDGRDFLFLILYVPFTVVLCIWFLYAILGWSSFLGMAVIVVMFPIPGYIATLIQGVQVEKMKKTDARVQTVTETMNVIRMIKIFGWEPRVNDRIADKREDELTYQKKFKLLELSNGVVNFTIPLLTMIVTYLTYTLVMKEQLTASRVFSSMAVFQLLQDQLHTIFGMLPMMVQAKVSLDRVSDFLLNTELLDTFTSKSADEVFPALPPSSVNPTTVGIRQSSFTWSNENDGTMTPGAGRRNFTLRIEEEVTFKNGAINLIIGPTGSGKTSMIMALLGEMHYIPSGPESYVSLPRAGGVAYAAQESWVQNETIRDNILFGAPYDEVRYNKVIDQCGLKRDLTLFEAGDMTEVGEKGLTLSGGQKARITLARAVYSSAEILLLDDVLAALDVHTARWIVEKCFKGDLIKGRTVLLVTHNISMTKPIADYVVAFGADGRITSQGSLSKALAKSKKLAAEAKEDAEKVEKADDAVDDTSEPQADAQKSDGKLIVEEEISEGHVGWPALKLYISNLGGDMPILFWTLFLGGLLLTWLLQTAQAWFLGYWADQYEVHDDPSEVNVVLYLSIYTVALFVLVGTYIMSTVTFVYGCLRASRIIHKNLVQSVLGTTLRWLDKTPTSRIIARCTQDIQAVDGPISMYLNFLVEMAISMLFKFAAVVLVSPVFLIPGILISALGAYCGQIYIKAQLSVKREMSNARAPVLGHFGAAIAGLTSIRAYGAQEAFRLESYKRIDKFSRAGRTFYNLNRWVSVRIEILGGIFAAGLGAYLVYGSPVGASNTGFSLSMAIAFSGMILWFVRLLNEFEVSGNSLERIQQYLVIEQEPKAAENGVPPAYWPSSGDLVVENLSARYSSDGPKVLHDISFHVKSGERVGIVGRTGSGKSSLTLSLLRCIITGGKVLYDGIPTDSINLDALRSNITIIPQVPELLSGTLRQNLDPFDQHDDAVLNDALRAAGLFSLQSETDEGRITLDSQISSGGTNLSVGQRQILALARAIVRQSKLLILDEATSAIDYETDTIIQSSLRQELGKDVTLLTIAHRLQTIMDADKIMVLDAGRLVEFDKPSELLKNPKGMLRALVDESGDREQLYAMAGATP